MIELLRKALEWQALLESGEVPNQAAIARREGISRARVTQVLGLLRLANEIQQHILAMPDAVRRCAMTERALRPIAHLESAGGAEGSVPRSDRVRSVGRSPYRILQKTGPLQMSQRWVL